ncbi:DUF2737 family protein [Klebsiella pneumoniae]|uniref:DUF2737 family protein n=2 Tax=Klebsiella pneumoniae TaxID=573 RepID=UPI0029D40E7D|nr:DUF2737 family protein [Klebsiella pneumoniae]
MPPGNPAVRGAVTERITRLHLCARREAEQGGAIMIVRSYDPSIFPDDLSVRRRQRPMPPRDELMKRNSFQSVTENKFLDALLKKMRGM